MKFKRHKSKMDAIEMKNRTLQEIKESLSKTNQEHLLQFYSLMEKDVQLEYLNHLSEIDFEKASRVFQKATGDNQNGTSNISENMKPIPATYCEDVTKCTEEKLQKYRKTGLEQISQNKVAVVLLAGGQGTRLGVSFPKGIYSVGLLSKKSLFQIQAERIRRLQQITDEKYHTKCTITWYIMTSEATERHTREYLEDHLYFGLSPKDVVIFEQGVNPCFDFNGRILLDDINQVVFAPNGNGGLYEALKTNQILQDMMMRGVQYVHVHSVDNILTKVADPDFVGYCVEKNAECGAKAVQKTDPNEPIGVICMVHDKYQVVEYSEISESDSNMRDAEGNLVYKSGNICNHFFTVEFLKKITSYHLQDLKLHVAKKKIRCINEKGQRYDPQFANGVKIEAFVFDVFQFAQKFVVYEVQRNVEFSAVKNSNEAGKDCPKTARRDLYLLHKSYVERNGGTVIGDSIEIDPLLSYDGENLEEICNGKSFESPTFISINDDF